EASGLPLPMEGLPAVSQAGLVPSILDRDPTPAVSELHDGIASALRQVAVTGVLHLPIRSIGHRWNARTGAVSPIIRMDPTEDTAVQSWVYGAVVKLLAEVGPRLRLCKNPNCRFRLFLWRRRQQRYCDRKCSDQA